MGTARVAAEGTENLSTIVTSELLREMAGDRAFGRGEAYFTYGAVRSLHEDGGGIKAKVHGTHTYRVHLWPEHGDLDYDCTCPVGQDDIFCKHCVAAGLAWLAVEQGDGADITGDVASSLGEENLRAYLLTLDKEELVSVLLDETDENERLYRRLTLRSVQATPGTASGTVWKEALDEALDVGGFISYRDAYDYTSGIDEVIDSLEELVREGQSEAAIELAEHGLTAVEECLEHVDDSDGGMYGLLERLQDLHLEACRQGKPNPVELAQRLFEAQCESSFGVFHRAVAVYAEILGETGLAEYRRLAEAEWAKVPARGPGDDDGQRFGSRYGITAIMEAIAEVCGDLEARVAVISRDLSSPYAFREIAELCDDAGDHELALDWAERGWQAFPDGRRDEGLRAFLADVYQREGRHDEAMTLMWEAFVDHFHLHSYLNLQEQARRAGAWPFWQEKALSLTRERIADERAEPSSENLWARSRPADHSLLVEIFLHQDDVDSAWHEAETGGCSWSLWLMLAKRREQSHPADAVRIYRTHVDSLLSNTGNSVYEEAVRTLEKISALLARSGEDAAFRPLITEIRARHKRKRNLMKLLDGKGW